MALLVYERVADSQDISDIEIVSEEVGEWVRPLHRITLKKRHR